MPSPQDTTRTAVGIRFTETMRGFFSQSVKDGRYEEAERIGTQEKTPFEFTLTITADDVDQFTSDANHQATMTGTATAPSLSPDPMSVSDGVFNLFVSDPAHADTRKMLYRMKLRTTAGRDLLFSGFKTVPRDTVNQAWPQLSTLYITIRDGVDDTAPIVGQGILHILPADFQGQMRSLETPGATTLAERARAFSSSVSSFHPWCGGRTAARLPVRPSSTRMRHRGSGDPCALTRPKCTRSRHRTASRFG